MLLPDKCPQLLHSLLLLPLLLLVPPSIHCGLSTRIASECVHCRCRRHLPFIKPCTTPVYLRHASSLLFIMHYTCVWLTCALTCPFPIGFSNPVTSLTCREGSEGVRRAPLHQVVIARMSCCLSAAGGAVRPCIEPAAIACVGCTLETFSRRHYPCLPERFSMYGGTQGTAGHAVAADGGADTACRLM